MSEKSGCRPKTGKLLVGGCFYAHTGYGIKKSWLAKENPNEYLFSKDDFSDKKGSFGERFILPAMEEKLPSIFIDLPMAKDNGVIKQTQGITILFLPEEEKWSNARYICMIPWTIMMVIENGQEEWRRWDRKWFLSLLEKELIKRKQEVDEVEEEFLRKKYSLDKLYQIIEDCQ